MAHDFRSPGTPGAGRRQRLAPVVTAVLLLAAATGAYVSLTGFDERAHGGSVAGRRLLGGRA